jgi:hypothetical protein
MIWGFLSREDKFNKNRFKITGYTIICKFYNRNEDKGQQDEINPKTNTFLVKDINCPVYYRFMVNSGNTLTLTAFRQHHNHDHILPPKVELTLQRKL